MEERNKNRNEPGKTTTSRRVKFIAGYQVELEGNALEKKNREKSR